MGLSSSPERPTGVTTRPDPCTRPLGSEAVWHDKWSDYTEAERHTMLGLLESFAHQQVMIALADLRLLPN